jgi:hypothetical protein
VAPERGPATEPAEAVPSPGALDDLVARAILADAWPEELLSVLHLLGRRGVDVEKAWTTALRYLPSTVPWSAFLSAVIEIGANGGRELVRAGPFRVPDPGRTTWVVTAANPGGTRISEGENAARHAALLAALRRSRIRWLSALGRDEAGTWHEESLALLAVEAHHAIEIGRSFQQAAVFQVVGKRAVVVPCRFRVTTQE